MKSDIGECVSVLYYKRWGKTLVGNKLRSRQWWEQRLQSLVNSPTVDIDPSLNTNPGCDNPPIPFEQEMGWTEETSEHWLKWVQKAFRRRYERKTTS